MALERKGTLAVVGEQEGTPDDALRQMLTTLVHDVLEATVHETLAVYILPEGDLRRKLRTTNSIEHEHGEVQRRTKVVRIFPNDASLLRLGTALAIERNEQWLERRYLNPEEVVLISTTPTMLTKTA